MKNDTTTDSQTIKLEETCINLTVLAQVLGGYAKLVERTLQAKGEYGTWMISVNASKPSQRPEVSQIERDNAEHDCLYLTQKDGDIYVRSFLIVTDPSNN